MGPLRVLVVQALAHLRGSYWFLPALMAACAILLSLSTTYADNRFGSAWIENRSWLSADTPDGARTLLATIAGSMIGVAGVTFSITIAAVAYATSQLGPHVLGNFMRDRYNQVTLGTFMATFLYPLLVLRTVQSHEFGVEASAASIFVPHIGILVALALTLASIGVLIVFFHHVPKSIQASQVIARVGHELIDKFAELFPNKLGDAPSEARDPEAEVAALRRTGELLAATASGYVKHVDNDRLLALAVEHDLVLRLVRRPGDFAARGEALLIAYQDRPLDDGLRDELRDAFAQGRERTQEQDALVIVRQLVSIAGRALSPGVNDPYTAVACLDWLGAALLELSRRHLPSPYRYDDAQRLRVIALPATFADFASGVFDDLRPYLSADRNAALHAMKVLERLIDQVADPARRAVLVEHAAALRRGAADALGQQRDVDQLVAVHRRAVQVD